MKTPEPLICNGRLILHNIYRTATLKERESVLITGKSSDDFPDINLNTPWNSKGTISNCSKELGNGDTIQLEQWKDLQIWHSGLSCQLFLKPKQGVLFDVNDENFLQEFHDQSRKQNLKTESGTYRIFLVYELRKGTAIPDGIGIERDGENHVCLFPTGDNIQVSDIEEGQERFTIDVMKALVCEWHPFALFQVRARGFQFPDLILPDSDEFPFRQWLYYVISYGEPDIALNAYNYVNNFILECLSFNDFLLHMVDIGNRFALGCDYDHIEINALVITALKFALDIKQLSLKQR